ncbi:MAG: hypothetical protein AB1632_12630 [Nitrospirota bacterium]
MKFFYWTILIILALVFQGRLSILGIYPDLTALMAYYAGIRYGETKGLLVGSLIGATQDIVSLYILGPNLLAKGAIGFLSAIFITGGIFRWTYLLGIIAVVIFTLIDNSIVFLSRSLFDKIPAPLSTALFIAIMQSILNAPAGIFIRPKHAD